MGTVGRKGGGLRREFGKNGERRVAAGKNKGFVMGRWREEDNAPGSGGENGRSAG